MDTVVSQSTRSKRPSLPSATYGLADLAGLVGCSYTTLNEQVRAGTCPFPVLRIGRQFRFPKAVVDRMLGLDESRPDAA